MPLGKKQEASKMAAENRYDLEKASILISLIVMNGENGRRYLYFQCILCFECKTQIHTTVKPTCKNLHFLKSGKVDSYIWE